MGHLPVPADLRDRRVEITGPTDRKMVINALNSGARMFMADFEDANSPTWSNLVEGQANLIDAIERRIELVDPGEGIQAERRRRDAPRPAARAAPPGKACRRRRWAPRRRVLRLRPLPLPQRAAAARPRLRAVPLPSQAREPPRSAALERRLHVHRGDARPTAWVDQGHRPDRDDPGRLRDGRDSLGAARPRRGPERGALGLPVQRDQDLPRAARVRPPRPQRRDHDRTVHARRTRSSW